MQKYPLNILDYLNAEIAEAANAHERKQVRKKWLKLVSEEITDRYNANRITNATQRTYRVIDSISVKRFHPYWDRVPFDVLVATERRLDQLLVYEKRAARKIKPPEDQPVDQPEP